MLGTVQRQSWEDSRLPCLLLVLEALVVLAVVPAEEAVLAVDLEVWAAAAAALVVDLLLLVAVLELGWLVVEVAAAGVVADLLSLLLLA